MTCNRHSPCGQSLNLCQAGQRHDCNSAPLCLVRTIFYGSSEKEFRTWLLPVAGTALAAAENIHTDLARGFIRAEIMTTADLMRLGRERKSKPTTSCGKSRKIRSSKTATSCTSNSACEGWNTGTYPNSGTGRLDYFGAPTVRRLRPKLLRRQR